MYWRCVIYMLSKCEQNDDMYIFSIERVEFIFAELLKCNHEKNFPCILFV